MSEDNPAQSLHGRRIDALIHQVFFEPVLMTGRGPFCRGIAVPAYTGDVGAALALLDILAPGDDWTIGVSGDVVTGSVATTWADPTTVQLPVCDAVTPAACLVAAIIAHVQPFPGRAPSPAGAELACLSEMAEDPDHEFGALLEAASIFGMCQAA